MPRSCFLLIFLILIPALIICKELRWDWSLIDVSQLSFPQQFLFGIASSEYQNSGARNCPNCDWAQSDNKFKSGIACDSWNRIEEDIACAHKLGINSYRFSIEWSLIEPQEGNFNTEALEHYALLCDRLNALGIKPVVVFHHFTNPVWFAQKGGFENRENVKYFVRYCSHVFTHLKGKAHLWCSINEPGVYAFQGYIFGKWPPYKINLNLAGRVLRNMLRAHVQVYEALKIIDSQAQIGIIHDIVQFESYHDWKVEQKIADYMAHLFYKAISKFFETGHFVFESPRKIEYHNKKGPKSLDFIGLNYYSHILMSLTRGSALREDEIPTDMPYSIYPEGLYRAIQEISTLKVPIYITENGISDAKDDRRALFIQRYIYAVSQAIKDGYDVRGYFYWSLLDNFEWNFGYDQKFGLYEIDFSTLERKLRAGAQAYIDIVKRFVMPTYA